MKDFSQKLDRFAHSYWFIALAAVCAFTGWALDNVAVSYYTLSFLILLLPFMTSDCKTSIIIIPFAMSSYREFFYFDTTPIELFVIVGAAIIAIILMVIRNLREKNFKLRFNIISKSLFALFVVLLFSIVFRHLFNNTPAFPEYAEDYELSLILGYLGVLVIFLLFLISLAMSSFKINDDNHIFTKTFYFHGLLILAQLIFVSIEYKTISPFEISNDVIGWAGKNTVAMTIEFTLPFIANTFRRNRKRVDALLIMLGLILYILTNNSRGGQITVVVLSFFLLYIILQDTKHMWVKYFTLVGAAGVCAILAALFIPSIRNTLDRLLSMGLDLSNREIFWKWELDYVSSSPLKLLFGGSFSYVFEWWKPCMIVGWGADPNTVSLGIWLSHNTVFTMLAIGGVLGVIVFIYNTIEAGYGVLKRAGDEKIVMFTVLVFSLIHGLIDNTYLNPFFMVPFVMMFSCYEKKLNELF